MNNNIKNLFEFDNKIALVLGGSGYIGSQITSALLQINCKVIILDKKKPKLKNKKLKFINFDVCQTDKYQLILNKLLKSNPKINYYVNASYPRTKSWNKCSFKTNNIDYYSENINLHLNSFVNTTKIMSDYFVKNKIKGKIVNLSSIYGSVAQNKELYKNTNMKESLPYPIIKGGINMMTRQFASYYGSYGIRINSVSPGGVIDKNLKKNYPIKFIKRYESLVPLKRFANPKEVAFSIIFLLSDASSYITGENLKVDGGWTII
jgi:NAD(P)-dependent dehydrogenase (short-subunit alcohol dehydrogenase family)